MNGEQMPKVYGFGCHHKEQCMLKQKSLGNLGGECSAYIDSMDSLYQTTAMTAWPKPHHGHGHHGHGHMGASQLGHVMLIPIGLVLAALFAALVSQYGGRRRPAAIAPRRIVTNGTVTVVRGDEPTVAGDDDPELAAAIAASLRAPRC